MRQARIDQGQRAARNAAVFISTNRANRSRRRHGRPHANRAAPVVGDQRNILKVERFDELPQIGHPLPEPVGIIPRARLVRQPAADVIDGHHPIAAAKRPNKLPPVERPGGVAMDHEQHRPRPLIHIVAAMPAKRYLVGLEGIKRLPMIGRWYERNHSAKARITLYYPSLRPDRQAYTVSVACRAAIGPGTAVHCKAGLLIRQLAGGQPPLLRQPPNRIDLPRGVGSYHLYDQ